MEQDENILDIKKTVSIEPLKSGGANFKTHLLVEKKRGILEFVPSNGFILFISIFLIVGLVFLSVILYKLFISKNYNFELSHLFIGLFPIIFIAVSVYMMYENFKPNQFNKTKNRYTKGHQKRVIKKSSIDISLSKIIALQLIGEIVSGNDSNYSSFELNIVMDDGERFNVVDHGNLKSLIRDAEWLSEFLSVPIWHAESSKGLINKTNKPSQTLNK